VALMVPRLRSAQFGLFDDPTTLAVSQRILAGDWGFGDEAERGRFRPLYWLYYAFVYGLVGKDPFWFFAGNLALLAGTTAALIGLTLWLTRSHRQAFLAGLLFVLAGPTVETAYTLSKPELVQGLWLVLSVLVLRLLGERPSGVRTAGVGLLVALLVLLANLSKETALVLSAIGAAWFILSLWHDRKKEQRAGLRTRASGCYLAGAALGNLAYLALRSRYVPYGLTERGYADEFRLVVDRMLASARVWFDWLNRDYLYLLPLVLGVLALYAVRRGQLRSLVPLSAIAWCAAWVGLYLPWIFRVEYYLYPFSLGAAILGAWLADALFRAARRGPWLGRVAGSSALAAGILLFGLALPNNITNARVQLTVDAANADLARYRVDKVPSGSLIVINIQEPNEYVAQLELLLRHIEGRDDLTLDHFHFQDLDGLSNTRDVYVVLPSIEGQFYQSVRLGVQEHTSRRWNESLQEALEGRLAKVHEIRYGFRMLTIDALRLFCPVTPSLAYCGVPNTPVDSRLFVASWRVYRLNETR